MMIPPLPPIYLAASMLGIGRVHSVVTVPPLRLIGYSYIFGSDIYNGSQTVLGMERPPVITALDWDASTNRLSVVRATTDLLGPGQMWHLPFIYQTL